MMTFVVFAAGCSKKTETYNPGEDKTETPRKKDVFKPEEIKKRFNEPTEPLKYENKTVYEDITIPFAIEKGAISISEKKGEGFVVNFTGRMSEKDLKTRRYRLSAFIRVFNGRMSFTQSVMLPEFEGKKEMPLNLVFFAQTPLEKSPDKAEIYFTYRDQLNEEQAAKLLVARWNGKEIIWKTETQETSYSDVNVKRRDNLAVFGDYFKNLEAGKIRVAVTVKTAPAPHQAVEIICGLKRLPLTHLLAGTKKNDSILVNVTCPSPQEVIKLSARDMVNGTWILDSLCRDKNKTYKRCKP